MVVLTTLVTCLLIIWISFADGKIVIKTLQSSHSDRRFTPSQIMRLNHSYLATVFDISFAKVDFFGKIQYSFDLWDYGLISGFSYDDGPVILGYGYGENGSYGLLLTKFSQDGKTVEFSKYIRWLVPYGPVLSIYEGYLISAIGNYTSQDALQGMIAIVGKDGSMRKSLILDYTDCDCGGEAATSMSRANSPKVIQLSDGGYFRMGNINGNFKGPNPLSSQVFFQKFSKDLEMKWGIVVLKKNKWNSFSIADAIEMRDGRFAFIASMWDVNQVFDPTNKFLLGILSSSGTLEWSSSYGIEGKLYIEPFRIQQNMEGDFIVSGTFIDYENRLSSGCILKISQRGEILWAQKFNDPNEGYGGLGGWIEMQNDRSLLFSLTHKLNSELRYDEYSYSTIYGMLGENGEYCGEYFVPIEYPIQSFFNVSVILKPYKPVVKEFEYQHLDFEPDIDAHHLENELFCEIK